MPKDYFICVDGMKETIKFYKKNLERKYKISKGIFASTILNLNFNYKKFF